MFISATVSSDFLHPAARGVSLRLGLELEVCHEQCGELQPGQGGPAGERKPGPAAGDQGEG